MEELMSYIRPELLVVSVVLYLIGIGLKKAGGIKDRYIPLILGGAGILLCGIHICCTGNSGGRTVHLRKPDGQADEKRRITAAHPAERLWKIKKI